MEFLTPGICDGLQHLSEAVFVRMCQIVGTSQQVAIRRETVDIREVVVRRLTSNNGVIQMLSGSQREGFRLNGSDVDFMYWPNNHRVIMDVSQSEYYNTANTTLILSNSSESPPGFTLLQLLTLTTDRDIASACVRMNDRVYISSSKYRELTCSAKMPNSTVHGPCGSGSLAGTVEYDNAHCFICDFWPVSALSWIDRCHSWPDPEVVDDIVRNGCHVVAIGNPLGPHSDTEWRISFSNAEYKCVYAMNHCQFLIYGLLKLFLKEVINQQLDETNKLLCSYHMKTTVFWAIQQNTLNHWCPQNLLISFWVSFKLLLKWVYEGICPNFFIPQNNMFLTKVHSSAQHRLFLQLHELYNKGLICLLQSSSVRSYIIDVFYNPRASIHIYEGIIKSEVDIDIELFTEVFHNGNTPPGNLHSCVKYLFTIQQLVASPLGSYQIFKLKRHTTTIFQNTAFILHNTYTNAGIKFNKQMYIADKTSSYILKLSAKFGCVSDMLYIVIYYYKTFRYREALSVLEITKVKLAEPYLMYDRHVDREKYIEAVGGQSWSKKMRQTVAMDIILDNRICYISELIPEQQSSLQNKWPSLDIPLFVMLHFLEFLCYRHVDTPLSQAALDALQVLVHDDQGLYVRDLFRDISWEILGICQQITGNLQAALYSYQQSLTQYPVHNIQSATQSRIQDMVQ
ncbi:uncharacterized protein [Magallana gigas]|uniref:uncharacterized protein n=1 Tax=Magallana gigas TaxID=29159 RepID=UPI00333F378D